MADIRAKLPANVEGTFFVDDTCIDCDLCRQIAPASFCMDSGQSIVYRQPETRNEVLRAQMSLVTCPTGSIGTTHKMDLTDAVGAYPQPIEDDVYFCGFASRDSFGGSSYLIVRPEGNVLVDSPRFARALVRRLEVLGGVKMMFLTHRDDVADHEKFRAHFGCERVIHRRDAAGLSVEWLLDGVGAMRLDAQLTAIPTPGHTRGHTVLHYRHHFLFTGDHLAWAPEDGRLIAFRHHNWYSWPETIRSMARLLQYRFEWVLPGHGRRVCLPAAVMSLKVEHCVDWMKRVA